MPQSLHAALAQAADAEHVSLNQFITSALASAVGWRAPEGVPSGPDEAASPGADGAVREKPPRRRSLVLTLNLVVLLLLAILAIVLLLTAWHQA
jgi:hypothetical protein